jgi:hypothetical protein
MMGGAPFEVSNLYTVPEMLLIDGSNEEEDEEEEDSLTNEMAAKNGLKFGCENNIRHGSRSKKHLQFLQQND